MSNQVSIAVKELRGVKTPNSFDFSSYRDLQRLPATKSNFKRTYLKGASHRVKSLKEESQFAELHKRKGNEKLYKFKRDDQLLKIRNLHLQKLAPLNTENISEDTNKNTQSKQITYYEFSSPNLKLIKDSTNQILELVYNPQPVIKKQSRFPLQNLTQKTEFQNSMMATQVTSSGLHSPKEKQQKHELSIMKPVQKKSRKDQLLESIQTTSYGSIRINTIETKIPQKQQSVQNSLTSLDTAKKVLRQYL